MENYFLNQRYTSDGESELGVGIVTETNNKRVKIHFPLSDETRLYAAESAPLRRAIFKIGDKIVDKNGNSLLVEKVELEDELYMYYGKSKKISEANLGDVTIAHGVEDRLFGGDVDSPELFALRRETLEHNYKRKLSPINGFVGGRIDLIPHQLYIAHEVSSRYAPRVLLSDQVGLGKTIEAGLILHRMLLNERISRVLILVPESLIHQWFVEMLRRFNLWFNIFDENRCAALDDNAPENNPFLDNQLIICSIEFLAQSKERTIQAISAGWDMLVVDEAHHLEWSVDNVSPEYRIVEQLSKIAKGLLLLTATPEQLGEESHFARLRLLDPTRYANYNDFKNEPTDHKDIADIVEKLSTGKNLQKKDSKLLESLFSKERMASFLRSDETATHNLIEDLLDQHGPGRVLFRNNRQAMTGFPTRKVHLAPIKEPKDTDLWMQRFSDEFEVEKQLNVTKKQKFWFNEDPRVLWLLKTVEDLYPAKILLICKSKEKVLALEEELTKRISQRVSIFHEDLTLVQRDRNAAWFADSDSAQLLLCSEIGSEGRNFQFAHHLILFDLPSHPELLEQRIGRLDRIGQTKDINIYVPYLINSPQHKLVRWYNEGLNAFGENLEDGNVLFKTFSDKLQLATSSQAEEADLENLIAETANFQQKMKKSLADGRDKLLEMNSFRPEVAKKLVNKIEKADKDKNLEIYLTKVFEQFDVEMEDLSTRTYLLHPASEIAVAFPSIPREGVSVTFDRQRALIREDISFLSWDHPMTTGAIDMVLSSTTGSASYGVLRGTGSHGLLLELLFVLETTGRQGIYVDRFLPNTPIRIVVDHAGHDVTKDYPTELLESRLKAGEIDTLLDNESFVDSILPNMISSATKLAEKQGAKEITKGLQRMNLTLNHEINRLLVLQKTNEDIRPEEIEIATEEQTVLSSTISNARIRLDALQLIRKE